MEIEKSTEIQACIIQIEALFSHQPDPREWKKQGSFPRQVLPILLQLLEHYFEAGELNQFSPVVQDYPKFNSILNKLFFVLKLCPLSDIQHLYGYSLLSCSTDPADKARNTDVSIKPALPYFMGNFLLRCLRGDLSNIKDEMVGLALSLAKYDPSQLARNTVLDGIYKTKGIGSGFSLKIFSSLVQRFLEDTPSPKIVELIKDLLEILKKQVTWSPEIIQKTRDIFALRWSLIKDDKLDYTRHPTVLLRNDPNNLWIKTAQLLSGAKLIEPNYYRFLIPTLTHDEALFLGPLVDYPLSDFILSEDETRLILLEASAIRCDTTKVFCNHSIDPPRKFTNLEEKRIYFAAPRFKEYLKKYSHYVELPLSRQDLDCLIKLVNRTLDPNALEERVDQQRLLVAEEEYANFIGEINKQTFLDVNNANRFLHHRTRLRIQNVETNLSIQDTLNNILLSNPDGCISSCGKYFAKTVLDYMPWFQFDKRIETSVLVGTSLMRESSAKKVWKEYDSISREEAIRRNNILMVSLLTFNFNLSWFDGHKVYLLDLSNDIGKKSDPVHQIFNQLFQYLDAKNVDNDPRHVYVSIIEGIVLPTLRSMSQDFQPTVLKWLKLINSESLFNGSGVYVEPSALRTALQRMDEKKQLCTSARDLLRELKGIAQYSNHDSLTLVQVNVKLHKILEQLGTSERETLLSNFSTEKSVMEANQSFANSQYSIYNRESRGQSIVNERTPLTPLTPLTKT